MATDHDLVAALDGATTALEMCQGTIDATSDDLAAAAVIAYLNLTGREAEGAMVADVRVRQMPGATP